jgi:hypothetical protein
MADQPEPEPQDYANTDRKGVQKATPGTLFTNVNETPTIWRKTRGGTLRKVQS